MSDAEIQSNAPAMTTGKAIMLYSGAIVVLSSLIFLAASIQAFPGVIAFIGYLALGFALNRIVLRSLIEYHPMYNTLGNVASAKIGMLTLWPFKYPVLFFRLLVSEHL